MYAHHRSERSILEALQDQSRVIYALMLRDIKTRFFGSGLGYLMYIAWPLSHIIVIVMMFVLGGRVAPYGDNPYIYIATGTTPFMCFSYSSRFIMMAFLTNKPLMAFPIVKYMDIIFARSILEALTAALIVTILMIIFYISGIDPMPFDSAQASYAFVTSIFLGIGFGMINSVIAAAMPFFFTAYVLVVILLWASSGVVFVPDNLPEPLRVAVSYIPTTHLVLWMRSAYYPGYGALTLDKTYVLIWAGASLCGGLILERLVRGRLLQG